MSTFEYKVQSVRKAFNTGLYESALALALTLPDICAIIEYPNITLVGERYIKWSNSHIFIDNPSNVNENFAGAALYQLRCNFLHSGSSDIHKNSGSPTGQVYIKHFSLMKPKVNKEGSGELLVQAAVLKDTDTQEEIYAVKMNLRYIIEQICDTAELFYEGWGNKSDFDDHTVEFSDYGADTSSILQ